jgi:hypothetical protein
MMDLPRLRDGVWCSSNMHLRYEVNPVPVDVIATIMHSKWHKKLTLVEFTDYLNKQMLKGVKTEDYRIISRDDTCSLSPADWAVLTNWAKEQT